MRRTIFLLALAVVVSATTVRAQVLSVYATLTNTRASNVQTGSVYTPASSTYVNQYTSFFASGIGGGVTLGALPLGPIHLGFDLRGSTKPGTNGVDTAMGGVRLGVKPPLLKIKPYIQASAGYVATRSNNVSTLGPSTTVVGGTFTNKYAAYEIFGGVDYRILPILDFRIIEIGGGQGFNTGLSFGSVSNGNTLALFNVNSGLVLHF